MVLNWFYVKKIAVVASQAMH